MTRNRDIDIAVSDLYSCVAIENLNLSLLTVMGVR